MSNVAVCVKDYGFSFVAVTIQICVELSWRNRKEGDNLQDLGVGGKNNIKINGLDRSV
jgi:hypothetical protein